MDINELTEDEIKTITNAFTNKSSCNCSCCMQDYLSTLSMAFTLYSWDLVGATITATPYKLIDLEVGIPF